MSKYSLSFGFALAALGLSGCFQETVTLGLPCSANDQCGSDQECDPLSNSCIEKGAPSPTTGGDESGEDTGSQGDPCAPNGSTRCDPVGTAFQICQNGIWTNQSCDQPCMDQNQAPAKQVGACVEQGGNPVCLCADGIGGQCDGSEPTTCTEAGDLQFCDSGRFFSLFCSTVCTEDGYPVGGPCVGEGQGQGSAACHCADGMGATCTIAEQFQEGCENATFYRRCVDETWWLTDCEAECQRLGQSGGSCQDTGNGSFSCVCG